MSLGVLAPQSNASSVPAHERALEKVRGEIRKEGAKHSAEFLIKVVKQGLKEVDAGRIPNKVHIDAAKTLLDRAGIVPPATDKGMPNSPGEMTGQQLRDALAHIERELSDRATIIEGVSTPVSAPDAQERADLLS